MHRPLFLIAPLLALAGCPPAGDTTTATDSSDATTDDGTATGMSTSTTDVTPSTTAASETTAADTLETTAASATTSSSASTTEDTSSTTAGSTTAGSTTTGSTTAVTGSTTEPEPVCGDGVVDPGEACDDGNLIDDDGCDATCEWTPCAIVWETFEYDPMDVTYYGYSVAADSLGDIAITALSSPGNSEKRMQVMKFTGDGAYSGHRERPDR